MSRGKSLNPWRRRARARSHVAWVQLPQRIRGRPGHFDDVRPSTLAEWRLLGEAGHLLAGLRAGYTPAEIAARRGWSATDLAAAVAQATAWYRARGARWPEETGGR